MSKQTANSVKIETEVKFIIPDYDTFVILRSRRKLKPFRFKPIGSKKVTDHYLDTAQRNILQAGFACRFRAVGKQKTISLKALTPPEGKIHRRQEIELEVDNEQPPTWPDCDFKDQLTALTANAPLQPLLALYQTRYKYHITLKDKPLMELSLDEVSPTETGVSRYFELEAELLDTGTDQDLERFIEVLTNKWNLPPAGKSKFERAFIDRFGSVDSYQLFDVGDTEKSILERIARSKDALLAKRANIILMSDVGVTPQTIAQEVELTVRTVKKWQRTFNQQRLDIFPAEIITEYTKERKQEKKKKKEKKPLGKAHPVFFKKEKKEKKEKKGKKKKKGKKSKKS
ncbi:MAG: CYTH domain-containing protein [Anaerolineae bacterium]|nr:CYTH domain-containing protein [Anaerolineae bacterium]